MKRIYINESIYITKKDDDYYITIDKKNNFKLIEKIKDLGNDLYTKFEIMLESTIDYEIARMLEKNLYVISRYIEKTTIYFAMYDLEELEFHHRLNELHILYKLINKDFYEKLEQEFTNYLCRGKYD